MGMMHILFGARLINLKVAYSYVASRFLYNFIPGLCSMVYNRVLSV